MQVHECFAVSGHEDGSICVWPADFSKVLLEAHHDAPIKSLDVSLDGMTVLTATQAVSESTRDGVMESEPRLFPRSVGDTGYVGCCH